MYSLQCSIASLQYFFYCTVPSGRKNTPHHISYTVSRFVNAITDLRIDLFLISLILFVKIIGNNIMNK